MVSEYFENGRDISVKCNVSEKLEIRDIDVIALLGNLLENPCMDIRSLKCYELNIPKKRQNIRKPLSSGFFVV